MKIPSCRAVLTTLYLASTSALFAQGPLTPPGPPAPMMKTLDQVEARTIVNASNTPGDANSLFIINSPGSYYLTGNIQGVSGKNGIVIAADNVSLDLNGFALTGLGSGNGITVSGTHKNLHIHHGSAIGWSGSGIDGLSATNSQFDHLRTSGNFTGLSCGDGCVVGEITAEGNSAGIFARYGCTLTGCCALNNNTTGIFANDGSTVTACISKSNSAQGFSIANNCTIIACVADMNGGTGFILGGESEIKDCTASRNSGNGISVSGQGARVEANNVVGNSGIGIAVTGQGMRVDANNVVANGTGLNIDSSGTGGGNLVIRNSLRGNESSFLSANTMNGPFITISDIITNSNPHANYLVP